VAAALWTQLLGENGKTLLTFSYGEIIAEWVGRGFGSLARWLGVLVGLKQRPGHAG